MITRPIADEPTPTPAEAALESEAGAAVRALSADDRIAAEVLIKHLFAAPAHEIEGITYATAYRLAHGAVGGDIVDVYHFDNGNVALAIADIAGKGAQAAIHAALVKYGLRCYASEGLTPERVLRSLDRVYLENNAFERTESFTSVFLAILDHSREALSYASAGHEPVVLAQPGEAARTLPPTAPLVGVFDDQHHLFKQRFVEMRTGSLLVATTDGVTEARNAHGEFFEMPRLLATIERLRHETPAQIVGGILRAVEDFAGDELHDDIAVVAMRVEAQKPTGASASTRRSAIAE